MLTFFQDTVRLSLRSIAMHKLRSALTILGIVFGVGSVIVMLAIGEGARTEAIEKISELGAQNVILRSLKPASNDDADGRAGIRYGLTYADLERVRVIPVVSAAIPSREHRQEVRHGRTRIDARVVGCMSEHLRLNHLALRSGRFISPVDEATQAPIAVLAGSVADALFGPLDPIGRRIRVGEDKYFIVVGVTRPRSLAAGMGDLPTRDFDSDIYIPFQTDRKRFGEVVVFHRATQRSEKLDISQITLEIADVRLVRRASAVVGEMLRDRHPQQDAAMVVPLELLEKVEQTQRIFTVVLGSVAFISLLVGGIGIMNIMLATVTERTREIGIRRAVGARQRDIARQFLIETTTLSGIGGTIGLAMGLVIAIALPMAFEIPTIIRLWSPLLAAAISVAVGIVFGALPARRAARMDPIEALRHD